MTLGAGTYVITGAAGGIGLGIAELLAGEGAELLLVDRSEAVLDVAARLGPAADAAVADLGSGTGVDRVADRIAGLDRCAALVNVAGIHPKPPGGGVRSVADTGPDEWRQVMDVNLTTPYLLSRAAVGCMAPFGAGRIVNVASRAGRAWNPNASAVYSASKAALIAFTRSLAGEVGPLGITANCVAPGRIRTGIAGDDAARLEQAWTRTVPVRRVGRPADVAAVVRFLLSAEAGYVTGATVDANGGVFG